MQFPDDTHHSSASRRRPGHRSSRFRSASRSPGHEPHSRSLSACSISSDSVHSHDARHERRSHRRRSASPWQRHRLEGGRLFSKSQIAFVANTGPKATQKIIYRQFSSIGKVLAVECQPTVGYASVLFEKEESVGRAISALDKTLFDNRFMRVRMSDKSRYFYEMPDMSRTDSDEEDEAELWKTLRHEPNCLYSKKYKVPQQQADSHRFSKSSHGNNESNRGTHKACPRFDQYMDTRPLSESAAGVDPASSVPSCEIIVLHPDARAYAGSVEATVKTLAISVSITSLSASDTVETVLRQAHVRGALFAVILHPSNEQRRSASLCLLSDASHTEHRNISLDSVVQMIERELEQKFNNCPQMALPPAALRFLQLAMKNRPLTGPEYDKLLQCLRAKRCHAEAVLEKTPGSCSVEANASTTGTNSTSRESEDSRELTADELNLQQRILKILHTLAVS